MLKDDEINLPSVNLPSVNVEEEEEEFFPTIKMKVKRSMSVGQKTRSCSNIYEFLRLDDGSVNKNTFIDQLSVRGILPDDPRLADVMSVIDRCGSYMQEDEFMALVDKDVQVIERAFTNSNNIHKFENFSNHIREMYYQCTSNTTGKMSDSIPQLSRQNPDHFALSLCTTDGQRLNIGHTDVDFCIQSCIKPISYCMALEEHGMDVHKHVGREPSGVRFNALKVMADGLPHNPLINSGAIMICSLIQQCMQPADRFDFVTKTWTDLAGDKPMGFSNSVYLSERNSSDRNFALAHFLRENKAFPPDVDINSVLEFYFQCFALTSDSDRLSIVAASLANGGVCPLTGKKVFNPETVKYCLSMMYSCGMYDYSGEFAFTVGLPACSGESGAIMVVVPNVMGICTFSPRLDDYGNSARGVDFFSIFTKKFTFHMFDNIETSTGEKEDPLAKNDAEEVTVEKIIRYSSLGDLTALKRLRPTVEDLSNRDYDRRTPLHLAASNGQLSVVEYLLEEIGLEHVNPIDRWLGSPYDDALREQYLDVAEFLRSVGGKRGVDVV